MTQQKPKETEKAPQHKNYSTYSCARNKERREKTADRRWTKKARHCLAWVRRRAGACLVVQLENETPTHYRRRVAKRMLRALRPGRAVAENPGAGTICLE